MSETLIVIPARWASTRLPGKPLADIGGAPMIARVVAAAQGVGRCLAEAGGGRADVVVATDDPRVQMAAEAAGARALLTASHHGSGTERLLEVVERLPARRYLNLQGDEPLFPPEEGCRLLTALVEDRAEIVSLCHPMEAQEASDPHAVKVVCNRAGDALYFSRAAIPYARQEGAAPYLRHVGVYAYSHAALERIRRLGPSPLEQGEGLEQLRWLEAGERLHMLRCQQPMPPGVDTAADLATVRRWWACGGPPAGDPVPEDRASLARIRLLISDVDGVLTDGRLHYGPEGETLKSFHVRDGLGIRLLESCGVRVTLMSGRDSAPLRRRALDLMLEHCRFGVTDKAAACRDLIAQLGLTAESVAFVGDDSIDLPAFSACGTAFAVADAAEPVRRRAHHVLATPGGAGALREVADLILSAQGRGAALHDGEAFLQAAQGPLQ
ncbi:MAG: 3-deoxy-manno-octulosonate cytidylyltransferase [Cyanobacteriota bacterium]|nr:3-deoxy-manno-octulosonate cytidylyltransferase [Cyanobacteriota bacterium]